MVLSKEHLITLCLNPKLGRNYASKTGWTKAATLFSFHLWRRRHPTLSENGDDCLSEADDGYVSLFLSFRSSVAVKKDDTDDSCDDDFYVDHGYLSDNEGSEAGDSNDDENSNQRKQRLGRRAGEFTKQRSNKSRRLKKDLIVRIYGLNWGQMPPERDLGTHLMKAVVFNFPKSDTVKKQA